MNGILIAIEGIDGAGKTTQLGLLAKALEACEIEVVTSKEPTDGPWGRKIRESASTGRFSLDEELEAFVEDRKEHVANLIRPALDRGAVVLLDRYYYSTIAYQGARGADVAATTAHMREIAPTPDAVLLIDIDPALSLLRISESRGDTPNHFERADSLRDVRTIFTSLASSCPEIHSIDGQRRIEDVYRASLKVIIDGPLKDRTCAKAYDCDPLYCAYRMAGECRWWHLRERLRQQQPATAGA